MIEHYKDLDYIVNYCKDNNVQLNVVFFPVFTLSDDHIFNIHTRNIIKLFKKHAIDVVDVAQLTKQIPVFKKVVNKRDAHANENVNRMVAEELIKNIK